VREADEFRAKAVECDKLADKAKDPKRKRRFAGTLRTDAMAAQTDRHQW
jgi:hypothetical protein